MIRFSTIVGILEANATQLANNNEVNLANTLLKLIDRMMFNYSNNVCTESEAYSIIIKSLQDYHNNNDLSKEARDTLVHILTRIALKSI